MSNYTDLMLQYTDGELSIEDALHFEKVLEDDQQVKQEYKLNKRIEKSMRADTLLHEVQEDIQFDEANLMAEEAVAEYFENNTETNDGLSFYISSSLKQSEELEKQVEDAKREMHVQGVDKETDNWVESWTEQKEELTKKDAQTIEIINFVKNGINADGQTKKITLSKPKKQKVIWRISSLAAAIALILGLWGVLNKPASGSDLFTKYYSPYPVIDGQTRSEKPETEKLFAEGVDYYKAGDFSSASKKFEALLEIDETVKVKLLHAVAKIELGECPKAKSDLTDIIKENGEYMIEAKWYLALCYLKGGDKKAAEKLLHELSKTPGYYKKKAIEMLDDL